MTFLSTVSYAYSMTNTWLTHLDGCKDDAAIDMLELRNDTLADVLALLLVLSDVSRESVQDGYSAPLRAFIQGDEKFVQDCGCNGEYSGVRG